MMSKRGASVLFILGALSIVAGLVIKFALVPALAKYPDDVDSTRTYAGTVDILNRAELANPTGTSPLFFEDLPVISDRTVKVEDVDGDKALVRDTANLVAAPGTPIEGTRLTGSDDLYTIDRVTMESIPNFTDDPQVLPREGLVIGWPIDTEARNYTGWNGDPAETVTLEYQGEEERAGRTTYVFAAESGPRTIVDAGTLAEFPASLPKAAVPAIAPLLGLPPELLGAIESLLPLLPDELPLEYTYEFSARYWVDPDTGVLIDVEKNDVRKAVVSVPGIPLEIEPVTVYNLNYSATEESREAAVADAEDYGGQLRLGRTTGPIGLWILGGALILAGLYVSMRRPPAPIAVPPHDVAAPGESGD